jgi:hypothetical protein
MLRSSRSPSVRLAFLAVATLSFLLVAAASARAETYFVTAIGTDAGDCTVAPCATVQYAIEQHRLAPQPDDVIDVGPGTFVGNIEADDALDDQLTIRGTLNGGTRETTLRGTGTGAPGIGAAAVVGLCPDVSAVTLRDVNLDTVGADPDVFALEVDGGSDLLNVRVANQPGSTSGGVVLVCQQGTTITRSEIVATDDDVGLAVLPTAIVRESTISAEDAPALAQAPPFREGFVQRIRRSHLSVPATSTAPVVSSFTGLLLDSSLITGGVTGVEMAWAGENWLINNSTIDAGQPGVSDPVNTPSLDLFPFGAPAEVTVDTSILVDGLVASSGDGLATCEYSDLPSTQEGPPFTIDCATGGATTNTTTPPATLFVGGDPFNWRLSSTSPGIDTGRPGPIPPGMTKGDLAGRERKLSGSAASCPDGIRDKGAYEHLGPPCLLQAPTIPNGANPTPGMELIVDPGVWSNHAQKRPRQWLRCNEVGMACTEVTPYWTRKTFRVRRPDVGFTFRVQVKGVNSGGESAPAQSDPTGVVTG